MEIRDSEIIQWLAGALAAIMAWIYKLIFGKIIRLGDKIDKVEDNLNEHRAYVDRNFPTRTEVDKRLSSIDTKLDKIIYFHVKQAEEKDNEPRN